MTFKLWIAFIAGLHPALASVEYDSSQAAEFDRLILQGAFYKPAELPITPKNYDRAVQASVRIGGTGETCSAVLISNDGYVATAIHCIDKCIKPTWGYTPEVNVEWPARKNVYDAARVLETVPSRLKCPGYMTSNFFVWDFRLSNPKIVWLGRGYLTNDEKNLVRVSRTEFDGLKDLTEDIAILKYEFEGEPRKLPCVPAALTKPAPQSPVWALGYPVRGPGYDYNGYKEYASLGRVRADITEDPILQSYANEIAPADLTTFWSYQKDLWQKDSVLRTTLQAAHGNSGGLIVDEHGNLAAILFSIMKSSPTYNGSTVLGVSLPEARAHIREDLGADKMNEIFNCR